jgi:hypothetical protein
VDRRQSGTGNADGYEQGRKNRETAVALLAFIYSLIHRFSGAVPPAFTINTELQQAPAREVA